MSETLLERPPELEVYGRSLSTIYRLGSFIVNESLEEAITSPEADQARVEFYTSVEEGFGTDMELGGGLEVRDFDNRPVIDGRVMAKDLKTAISSMTESGLVCAEKEAEKDWRFKPQLTRSVWDHQNALAVDKMARGETNYNTRIVISPFPEEAAAQSGSDYWRKIGYVPHLKRGFVQMYHLNGEEVVSGSLSFDGSDKRHLRAVLGEYGVEIPEEEITDNWLKYALTTTMSEDQARSFSASIADRVGISGHNKNTNTVDVTREYRSVMDKVFDESYVHISESLFRGYQTDEMRGLVLELADKAIHFNENYASSLYRMRANRHEFSDEDSAVIHDFLVYSTIEMMRSFHLKKVDKQQKYSNVFHDDIFLDPAQLQLIGQSSFQNMLGGFGADGARNNRIYSACGLEIKLGEDNNEPGSPQEAYGGKDRESSSSATDKFGPLKFKCKYGHWNKRPPNEKITKCIVPYCKKGSVGC